MTSDRAPTTTPPRFHAVHRARARRIALQAAGVLASAVLVWTVAWAFPATASPPIPVAAAIWSPPPPVSASSLPAPSAGSASAGGRGSTASEAQTATTDPVAEGLGAVPVAEAVAPSPAETAPAEAVPQTGATQRSYDIDVDTTGYQAEIDACLWVRMDIGAVAPIVGAHNHCGGDVVLGLAVGDLVTVTGEGVDGDYVVTGSRDGYPGQNAAEATAGLVADLILQTCYWEGDEVRLVTLLRAADPAGGTS